ncbi:MAG: 1-acyl-sn-glycerol-3-phosphate acyltransferase [Nakamurella sp.]
MKVTPGSLGELRGRIAGPVNAGAGTVLRGGIDQLVRRNLRGVFLDGELPAGSCVWAANHHSWWDFFAAAAALRAAGRHDVGVLMDAENVGRQSLFRQVGVVGTDRLRTAAEMLGDGWVLVVFPEGELRAPGPLGDIRPGARWLADRSGADLRTVATRVVLRGQQAPEAYLRLSGALASADDVAIVLDADLRALDRSLATADPMQPLPGFRSVVTGVRSWQERFGVLRGGR